MLHVGSDESILFFGGGIVGWIDGPGSVRMMIVVAPFCKVVGKFVAWEVGTSIFKVNDNKLFMLVSWVQ